jgi:hypothetical protein
MTLQVRLARLEGRQRERLQRTATLFAYADGLGRERRRVVVMQTGETLDLAEFWRRYPDGEVAEFAIAGVDLEQL